MMIFREVKHLTFTRICTYVAILFLSFWSSESVAVWKKSNLQEKALRKQMKPKKVALVIGVGQFQSPHWSQLKYAKHDAVRVAKTFLQAGKFDRIVLRNKKSNTTKHALLKALYSLKKYVKNHHDRVVVYISSHGTFALKKKTSGHERFIITSDTAKKVASTALSLQKVLQVLKQLPSRQIVLILATCYTGAPNSKSQKAPGLKGNIQAKPIPKLKAIQVLSATGYAQPAFESSRLKSDIYTYYFLKCLRKLHKKGRVTAIEAHACAAEPTTLYVKENRNEVQVPKVDSEQGANRDVVLFESQNNIRQVGYFSLLWSKFRTGIVRIRPVSKGKKGSTTQRSISTSMGETIALAPGTYQVKIVSPSGQPLDSQEITIQKGKTTSWGKPFPWSSFVSAGILASDVVKQQILFGGRLTFANRFLAVSLGIWGSEESYTTGSFSQLYVELQGDGGWTWQWKYIHVFVGASLGLGLLLQNVGSEHAGTGLLFRYGAVIAPMFKLTQKLGIRLDARPGFLVFQRAGTWQHMPFMEASLGLSISF